ncbi:DUF3006 domain-containing protein [Alkalihalophilus marmarensis]|uniref:DUF3006 domain-containing protein n=1 Tax=Alkalihalophilus marmarensis DSM 21297 TaxID=1188261 RepID=U6SRM7_9BACI|nr:DUF3006 domain-containing protein [Alkalihalophilus marmarensis]ERN54334.1 hypothetical protein A33I_07915 [Alkalihalophilus marmarensis DSM 21297]
MAKYIVDRIVDGQIAVLLLKDNEAVQRDINVTELPSHISEGDMLEVSFSEEGKIIEANLLKAETEDALNKAKSLLEKLKNKNK